MSSEIQRKNHRIHPCDSGKKLELLTHLIGKFPDKHILIATANDTKLLQSIASKNITIVTDNEVKASEKNSVDILISYDLPEKALIYMTRFAHAREMALILLDSNDQKNLYPIETLLGRTIIQEVIAGFEPSFGIAVEQKSKAQALERRKMRDEEAALKADKWAKKDKEKSVFLGTDESGKPIFSQKSRDRNHYIDGTPRSREEKATKTKFGSKPVFFGDKEQLNKPKSDDKKKPYGEKKPFDKDAKKPFGEKKPYGDKKPFDKDGKKEFGDKKSFGDKKPYGDKKPFDKDGKKPFGNKKPYDGKKSFDKPAPKEPATPTRTPRKINVKSLKPKEQE